MATTGREAFDFAIVLIDEMPETGVISDGAIKSYLVKAPALITMLETELAHREGVETPDIVTDLSLPLTISDKSARMILPYGLAAHLVLEENADSASFFQQRYEELRRKIPRKFKKIKDVYGGVTYGNDPDEESESS